MCPARYGLSYAHGRELRAVAEGLSHLPLMREAFLRGVVGRSKVRDLVAVAAERIDARVLDRHRAGSRVQRLRAA